MTHSRSSRNIAFAFVGIVCLAWDLNAAQRAGALIVPGQGIGPVTLGMTSAEVFRALGDPTSSNMKENTHTWTQEDASLTVVMNRGAVEKVYAQGSNANYRTANGVGLGSTDLGITATLGEPSKRYNLRDSDGQTYAVELIYTKMGIWFRCDNSGHVDMVVIERDRR